MTCKVLITREQIAHRLPVLAREIETTLPGSGPVHVLVLLNGGLWFAADLLRHLPDRYILETMRVSSYGDGKTSSGKISWLQEWPDVAGKTILVLDDVIDAGHTMAAVCGELTRRKAQRVYTVVAVNKKGRREVEMEPDFSAFEAGREFLVGYGLDHAGKYRNLPCIAVLDE